MHFATALPPLPPSHAKSTRIVTCPHLISVLTCMLTYRNKSPHNNFRAQVLLHKHKMAGNDDSTYRDRRCRRCRRCFAFDTARMRMVVAGRASSEARVAASRGLSRVAAVMPSPDMDKVICNASDALHPHTRTTSHSQAFKNGATAHHKQWTSITGPSPQ